MKVIFLDIDGVLNSNDWYVKTRGIGKQDEGDMDPNAINLINQIIEKTGAKIIISSSWRTDFENCCRHLYEKGLMANAIVGSTPNFVYSCQSNEIRESLCRGNEIQYTIWSEDISYYVILDDDCDMLYCQKDNFIHVNFMHGITEENVEQAIKILNKHE